MSLTWSISGTFISVLVTQVNSLAGTSEAVDATATARSDGWDFEYSLEGMNVVRVDAQMSDGWTYHYEADVTVCGATAIPGGGPVSGPPDDPEPVPANLVVSGAYLVCGEAGGFGFNYSTSREVTLVVYAMHLDNFQQVGDAITGQSGEFYSQFYNEGALSFEVAVYETSDASLANPIDGYSEDLTCQLEPEPEPEEEVPTATETPTMTAAVTETVVPVETPTATSTETVTATATAPQIVIGSPMPIVTESVPTEAPQPTPLTFSLVIKEPSLPTPPYPFNIPEVNENSKPGDVVRVNIADPGKPEDWVVLTFPDPKEGAPVKLSTREKAAFLKLLSIVPKTGNIYFIEPVRIPTIQIIPQAPVLIEQKENSPGRRNMSLGVLLSGDDEEDGLVYTRMAVTLAAGLVVGSFMVYKWGPFSPGTAGLMGTIALSQDPAASSHIFTFFVGPGEDWQLPPLPAGTYVLTLETLYGKVYNFPFTLTGDPTESLMFQQNDHGEWELVVVNNGGKVASLPETGVGQQYGLPLMIWGLVAVGLGMMSFGIRRLDHVYQRNQIH